MAGAVFLARVSRRIRSIGLLHSVEREVETGETPKHHWQKMVKSVEKVAINRVRIITVQR